MKYDLRFYSIKGYVSKRLIKCIFVFLCLVDTSLVDREVDCIYFCGNSLGLQPKQARTLVNQEMDKWQQMYVAV